MDRIIRAALEGDEAEPGRVAAADVARLVLGLQTTLRRAAFSILGRFPRAITGGRYEAAIEDATRLKFVAVEPGSFVSVLALPEVADGDNTLAVDVSLQDLGYRSFHRLLDVLDLSTGTAVEPTLASAVAQLAEDVNVGGRTSRIRLESMAHADRLERRGVIDRDTRRRMQDIAASPRQQKSDMLYGRLMEADFERHTARLRLGTGEAVVVTFGEDLADDIQRVLREPNMFSGEVSYDASSGQATRVLVRAVAPPAPQLAIPVEQFREHRTVAELAEEQGIHAPQNLAALRSREIDDGELAAFVAAANEL